MSGWLISQRRSMPSAEVKSAVPWLRHDEPLVGLEHRSGPTGLLHRELHGQLVELHARAGVLAVEGERNPRLVGEVEVR